MSKFYDIVSSTQRYPSLGVRMNSFILDLFLCAFVFGWKGDEAAEMAEHLVLIFVEEFMVMWQWMFENVAAYHT